MVDFQQDTSREDVVRKLEVKKKEKESELKKLEEQKKKELEETEAEIRKAKDAVTRAQKRKSAEEEEITKALEELEKKKEALLAELASSEKGSLEEMIAEEKVRFTDEARANVQYMTAELRAEEATIYAITNYNVLNHLTEIRNKAAAGEYISGAEREFVEEAQKQAKRFVTDQDYLSVKDPFDYVERTQDVLSQIDNYVNLRKKEGTPSKTRRGEL
jgi:DNA repair exonuclease SbcCD ATPase subunit